MQFLWSDINIAHSLGHCTMYIYNRYFYCYYNIQVYACLQSIYIDVYFNMFCMSVLSKHNTKILIMRGGKQLNWFFLFLYNANEFQLNDFQLTQILSYNIIKIQ